MVWLSAINALIGVWFALAPFVLDIGGHPTATWLSIAGGLALLLLAGWTGVVEPDRPRPWIQAVSALIGLWFVVAPSLLRLGDVPHLRWTSLLGGWVVIFLSGWMAVAVPRGRAPA